MARLEVLETQILARPAEVYAEVLALWPGLSAAVPSPASPAPDSCPGPSELAAQATALQLLSRCAVLLGEDGAAAEHAETGRRLAHDLGLRSLEARCLEVLGVVRGRQGDVKQAAWLLRRSLYLLHALGDTPGQGRLLGRVGDLLERLEEYPQALLFYRAGLARLPAARPVTAAVQVGLARTLHQLGEYAESQELAAQALAVCQEGGLPQLEAQVQLQQALTQLALGELDASRRHAEQAQALAAPRHAEQAQVLAAPLDHTVPGAAAWVLGEAALVRGDLAQAREGLGRAEELANTPPLLARVRGSQSRLYEQLGDPAQALRCLREQRELEQQHRARLAEQRAGLLAEQIRYEVLRREAELQRKRRNERAQAASALRETRVELSRQASHDQLTGLANRSFFYTRARQALDLLAPGRSLGLIVADIDHLKAINDRFGYAVGDLLITELARRLREAVRPGDLVGRLSGDEFVMLLSDLASPGDLRLVAERLLQQLREPCVCGTELVVPTVSLGYVVAPQDGGDVELLQKRADLALFQAKAQGRNMAVAFAGDMSAEEQERRQLSQDLRHAVRHGQLQLHYQGIFLLPGQRLSGFEALVRWPHPKRGMIPPDRFIALAEESRLILELGRWVLDEACRQARAWQLPERGLTMAVNVSALQFEQSDFVAGVRACLKQHGLPGHSLVIELTESMVHRDPRLAKQTLRELRSLGIKVAMDDFGTGYSSLSMLKSLPFGLLKIDREFLQDLSSASEQFAASQQFIEVMVRLAHNLQMRVVAEGVETAEQYDLLCGMGCDEAQGYWLARPLPPAEAAALLPTGAPDSLRPESSGPSPSEN